MATDGISQFCNPNLSLIQVVQIHEVVVYDTVHYFHPMQTLLSIIVLRRNTIMLTMHVCTKYNDIHITHNPNSVYHSAQE